MDSSQNYQDLLEPGLRAAKKRLQDRTQNNGSPLAGEMNKKRRLRKIKQKYGGYKAPGGLPSMQYEGDPRG